MKKTELNAKFRTHVKNHLSPTEDERNFVTKIYEAFRDVLGEGNCIQIGSYPRFTAITPMHDLDILFIIGRWPGSIPNPSKILSDLQKHLEKEYNNPTRYTIKVLLQTHSISVVFLQGDKEFFAVDIVPAYILDENDFGDDRYMVPEIISRSRNARRRLYEELARGVRNMTWIKSDPRGYIEVAKRVNEQNIDFRKSVKFVKGWRSSCKKLDPDFKLKSFHIEQVITHYFRKNTQLEIFDAVFNFFCDLPSLLERSQIPDRADSFKNIDDYVDKLTHEEKEKIKQARDFFLIKLEEFSEDCDVAELLEAGFYERRSIAEKYLFDYRIPVFLEKEQLLKIKARVLPREGGFREKNLDALGVIEVDRKIEFRVSGSHVPDLYKWKVKNDDRSPEPRGEITDHYTRNDPESTKYKGEHFVECYAIKKGICTARARQNVRLKPL